MSPFQGSTNLALCLPGLAPDSVNYDEFIVLYGMKWAF